MEGVFPERCLWYCRADDTVVLVADRMIYIEFQRFKISLAFQETIMNKRTVLLQF